MKRIPTNTIAAFDCGFGYIVEIALDIDNNIAQAWLYHKDYAVKTGMFAVHLAEGETIEDFINLVETALPEYIDIYFSDYMDGTEEEQAALKDLTEESIPEGWHYSPTGLLMT